MFEVRAGSFSYEKDKYVLKELSFQLQESQILSVLGPNGAGKTTLLKCMLGLLPWNSGASYLQGRDIRRWKNRSFWQQVGYVQQAKSSSFAYTVEEMVVFGRNACLGLFGQPGARDREIAEAAMEELGICNLRHKLCSEISGGELQLTLIARALAVEPSVLVLDEPEANLDFRNQLIVLSAIERLCHEKHLAVIVNTHYPEHALTLADQVLLLSGDGSARVGTADAMITEEHLREVFGVQVKLVSVMTESGEKKSILPIALEESQLPTT